MTEDRGGGRKGGWWESEEEEAAQWRSGVKPWDSEEGRRQKLRGWSESASLFPEQLTSKTQHEFILHYIKDTHTQAHKINITYYIQMCTYAYRQIEEISHTNELQHMMDAGHFMFLRTQKQVLSSKWQFSRFSLFISGLSSTRNDMS